MAYTYSRFFSESPCFYTDIKGLLEPNQWRLFIDNTSLKVYIYWCLLTGLMQVTCTIGGYFVWSANLRGFRGHLSSHKITHLPQKNLWLRRWAWPATWPVGDDRQRSYQEFGSGIVTIYQEFDVCCQRILAHMSFIDYTKEGMWLSYSAPQTS